MERPRVRRRRASFKATADDLVALGNVVLRQRDEAWAELERLRAELEKSEAQRLYRWKEDGKEIDRLRAENAALREQVREVLVQARGALRLDAMVDDAAGWDEASHLRYEVDELVQDVFLEAHRGLASVHTPAALGLMRATFPAEKLNMAIGDARLLADGKEIYVANDLRVGLFLREGEGQGTAA